MSTRRRVALVFVAALGLAAGLGGCSAVLGIEADRHVVQAQSEGGTDAGEDTAEAAADVVQQPPGWECLNNPEPTISGTDVRLRVTVNDVSSASSGSQGTPIVGAELHYCTKLDLTCSNPMHSTTTDDAGIVTIGVPDGFDGYFELHANNYTPALLARSKVFGDELAQQSMANLDLLSSSAGLVGITQDPNKTIAIITAFNCSSDPAAGIVIDIASAGADEQAVYFENKLPSTAATSTDPESGSVIVFNVPPGAITVTARFAETNRAIKTFSGLARKGWVTYMQLRADQAARKPIN